MSHPDAYTDALERLWFFYLPDDPEPHGLLTDSIVERMPWTAHFHVATSPRKHVRLLKPDAEHWQAACGDAIQALVDLARERGVFPRIAKKTTELFPILGARFDIAIERSAFSLFGIVGRGAHMTVYTRSRDGDGDGTIKFWIARRSAAKSTYPSMLDQAVAGGVARGETPLECIVREAGEEAGLSPALVRENAVAAGTVSWFGLADERAGGEVGLVNPGVLYVYDLEVPESGVACAPADDEIQHFSLMELREVLAALRNGEFKPSCDMVMLDFLVRHGFVTAENEPDYGELIARLHRKLPLRITPA